MTNYEWLNQQLNCPNKTSYDIPRYIYFIQRADTQAIKIGMTHDPLMRYARLQRKCKGTRLSVLGFLLTKQLRDFPLHRRFEHLRLEGEWFASDPDLLSFIDKNTTLDLPKFDIDKYHQLQARSPWPPRCFHCNRLAGKSPLIAGKDPLTGKTGAFHKACYSHRKCYAEEESPTIIHDWQRIWEVEW